MSTDILTGNLTRLAASDQKTMAEHYARWRLDSEYQRLLDSDPPRLWSAQQIQKWLDKDVEQDNPNDIYFLIRKLEDDQPLGFVALFELHWNQGEAWIAIALGERDSWGQGYGSDAMNTMLRYCFQELNLRRITLVVFEYNARARRAYEKLGFVYEGQLRSMMQREGRRWDWYIMGLLREEWQIRKER
jgi:RimJ/RimL family protein N-acetyltransferase